MNNFLIIKYRYSGCNISICSNAYHLIYSILSDFVIDKPADGFPGGAIIDCIDPVGYRTQWVDKIWLRGRWKNLELMLEPAGSTGELPKPRCIDPNKCYKPKPNLPKDWTVEMVADNVDTSQNTVNTSFTYKCGTESKMTKNLYLY